MPIKNVTKLFKAPNGQKIVFIRASTLAGYWYCAIKAWCEARGIEAPSSEALDIGKKIHDQISNSRASSKWEIELENFLKQFMVDRESGEGTTGMKTEKFKVFMREWKDGEVVVGHVVTHGVDDFRCSDTKQVTLVEYKTTNQRYIDSYKLAPATFQIKLYAWILEPYLKIGGYTIHRLEIVYLNRRGDILGTKQVEYSAEEVEKDIAKILKQFNDPSLLIPPAKFKCLHCDERYKRECPFIEQPKT